MRLHRGSYVFSRNELWNLDLTLSKIIGAGLEQFKNMERYSYPPALSSLEEWNEILDKMIKAFKVMEGNVLPDKDSPTMKYLMEHAKSFDIKVDENGRLMNSLDIPDDVEEAERNYNKEKERIIKEGLQLFSKHFESLWD